MRIRTLAVIAVFALFAVPAVASVLNSESAMSARLIQEILDYLGFNRAVQTDDVGEAGRAEIEPTKVEFPTEP